MFRALLALASANCTTLLWDGRRRGWVTEQTTSQGTKVVATRAISTSWSPGSTETTVVDLAAWRQAMASSQSPEEKLVLM